jgi:hypothetical protein
LNFCFHEISFLFLGTRPESTVGSAAKPALRLSGKVALFRLAGFEPFTAPSIHSKASDFVNPRILFLVWLKRVIPAPPAARFSLFQRANQPATSYDTAPFVAALAPRPVRLLRCTPCRQLSRTLSSG